MTSIRHDFKIHPATRIGYVSLNVSNIDRSLDFYEKVLGFKKVNCTSSEATVRLSVGKNTRPSSSSSFLVELLQTKKATEDYYQANMSNTTRKRRAGLY